MNSDAADPAGREPGCEAATLPRSAADLELGLVSVERMLDDGQSEAGSTHVA